jgi:hypothetical protein
MKNKDIIDSLIAEQTEINNYLNKQLEALKNNTEIYDIQNHFGGACKIKISGNNVIKLNDEDYLKRKYIFLQTPILEAKLEFDFCKRWKFPLDFEIYKGSAYYYLHFYSTFNNKKYYDKQPVALCYSPNEAPQALYDTSSIKELSKYRPCNFKELKIKVEDAICEFLAQNLVNCDDVSIDRVKRLRDNSLPYYMSEALSNEKLKDNVISLEKIQNVCDNYLQFAIFK